MGSSVRTSRQFDQMRERPLALEAAVSLVQRE
jgi:hypothetical protein